jgi:hypothetical protein
LLNHSELGLKCSLGTHELSSFLNLGGSALSDIGFARRTRFARCLLLGPDLLSKLLARRPPSFLDLLLDGLSFVATTLDGLAHRLAATALRVLNLLAERGEFFAFFPSMFALDFGEELSTLSPCLREGETPARDHDAPP